MNGLAYLLDSDRIIDFLKGDPDAVVSVRELVLGGIGVSTVTYGEVYEGILYGRTSRVGDGALRRFLQAATLSTEIQAWLNGSRRSVVIFAPGARGMVLEVADLLIAATVTHNRRRFARVPGSGAIRPVPLSPCMPAIQ